MDHWVVLDDAENSSSSSAHESSKNSPLNQRYSSWPSLAPAFASIDGNLSQVPVDAVSRSDEGHSECASYQFDYSAEELDSSDSWQLKRKPTADNVIEKDQYLENLRLAYFIDTDPVYQNSSISFPAQKQHRHLRTEEEVLSWFNTSSSLLKDHTDNDSDSAVSLPRARVRIDENDRQYFSDSNSVSQGPLFNRPRRSIRRSFINVTRLEEPGAIRPSRHSFFLSRKDDCADHKPGRFPGFKKSHCSLPFDSSDKSKKTTHRSSLKLTLSLKVLSPRTLKSPDPAVSRSSFILRPGGSHHRRPSRFFSRSRSEFAKFFANSSSSLSSDDLNTHRTSSFRFKKTRANTIGSPSSIGFRSISEPYHTDVSWIWNLSQKEVPGSQAVISRCTTMRRNVSSISLAPQKPDATERRCQRSNRCNIPFVLPIVFICVISLIILIVLIIWFTNSLPYLEQEVCYITYPSPQRLGFLGRQIDITAISDKSSTLYHTTRDSLVTHLKASWELFNQEQFRWPPLGVAIGKWYCPHHHEKCLELIEELSSSHTFTVQEDWLKICEATFTDIDSFADANVKEIDSECHRLDRISVKAENCPILFKDPLNLNLYVELKNYFISDTSFRSSVSSKQMSGLELERSDEEFYRCSTFSTVSDFIETTRAGNSTSFELFPLDRPDGDDAILHPCGSRVASVFSDQIKEIRTCEVRPNGAYTSVDAPDKAATHCRASDCPVAYCVIYDPVSKTCLCRAKQFVFKIDYSKLQRDNDRLNNQFKNLQELPVHAVPWLPPRVFPNGIEDAKFVNWMTTGRNGSTIISQGTITEAPNSIDYDTTELLIENRYNADLYEGEKVLVLSHRDFYNNHHVFLFYFFTPLLVVVVFTFLLTTVKLCSSLVYRVFNREPWYLPIETQMERMDELVDRRKTLLYFPIRPPWHPDSLHSQERDHSSLEVLNQVVT